MGESSVEQFSGFEWCVSDDRLSVLVKADADLELEVTADQVVDRVKSSGILAEIDRSAIQNAFTQNRGEWVTIASGMPPVPPVDAALEYLVDLDHLDLGPSADEHGKIDYKKLQLILNVSEGQELIRKHPGVPGQPGEDVYGNPVPPSEPRDIQIPKGEGIRINEDGMLAVAAVDGAVIAKRQEAISRRHSGEVVELFEDEDTTLARRRRSVRELSVTKVHKIVGDISLRTGNIDFNGTVHITGNVPAGFEVRADGDIVVGGLVEGAILDAKGNVNVNGGIQGASKARISAGESIRARFANDALLMAGNEIILQIHLMNCEALAGSGIRIESSNGVIAGGRARADSFIGTAVAGSDLGVKTTLQIGREDNLMAKIGETEGKVDELTKRLGEIQEILMRLNTIKQAQGTLPAKHEQIRIRAVQNQFAIMGQLDQVNKTLIAYKRILEKNRAGEVQFRQTAHAGVVVLFPGDVYTVKHDQKHFACFYSKGEIHTRAL